MRFVGYIHPADVGKGPAAGGRHGASLAASGRAVSRPLFKALVREVTEGDGAVTGVGSKAVTAGVGATGAKEQP